MRYARLIRTVLVAISCAPAVGAAQLAPRYELADLKALEQAFTGLAERVLPSVVAIRTYRSLPPRDGSETRVRTPLSQGSGFVIDRQGDILTNRHVLDAADSISVILYDGRELDATLVQADLRLDIAVIRVEDTTLTPVQWAEKSRLRVNQWAFACGNPLGIANLDGKASMSFGVISALGRDLTHLLASDPRGGIEYYGNLIEISTSIQSGNSGGPLFNVNGEVIGIITALESSNGARAGNGFAIPLDGQVRRLVDMLKQGKSFRYGFLGVTVDTRRFVAVPGGDGRTRLQGALVTDIASADSPASQAGLQPGDVVVELDGVQIRTGQDLIRVVGLTPAGARVQMRFRRQDHEMQTEVVLADRLDNVTRRR